MTSMLHCAIFFAFTKRQFPEGLDKGWERTRGVRVMTSKSYAPPVPEVEPGSAPRRRSQGLSRGEGGLHPA